MKIKYLFGVRFHSNIKNKIKFYFIIDPFGDLIQYFDSINSQISSNGCEMNFKSENYQIFKHLKILQRDHQFYC